MKIWDIDGLLPYIKIGSAVVIPTYFLVISIGFCISILFLIQRARKLGLDRTLALDSSIVVMVSGFVGARIFHVLYEAPLYYAEDMFRVFEIWRGGFVWYGGAIGGFLGFYFFSRIKKMSLGLWLDGYAPVCALGYMIGRISCFLTGCCFGGVCYLTPTIAFQHPTQLYAVIWEGLLLTALLVLEKKMWHRRSSLESGDSCLLWRPGALFAVWILGHGAGRLMMEYFRADERGPELFGLSISSWISLFTSLAALVWVALPKAQTALQSRQNK